MRIDQRNAGASVTILTTTGYTLDRWNSEVSQSSKLSIQQNAGSVTPPAGFTNYLGITSLSAYSIGSGDYFAVIQRIEGFNIADLAWGTANAKTITLSFWVRSSLTGTFGGGLKNATSNYNYPFSYTISSANTWEQKSITISGATSGTWSTDSGIGVQVYLGLGVGSTYSATAGTWITTNVISTTGATSVVGTNGATWYVTGVQLEIGTSATPFERRLYNQELANCQRYYDEQVDELLSAVASSTTNVQFASARFTQEMRIAPTVTFFGNSVSGSIRSSGGATVTLNSPGYGATPKGLVYINVSSGLTTGVFYQCGYKASAEL
jgi:hypothetical protein